MEIIPYTNDPIDMVGQRCGNRVGNLHCHRRAGHPTDTKTIFVTEDELEVIVEFNHRALQGGKYFAWGPECD